MALPPEALTLLAQVGEELRQAQAYLGFESGVAAEGSEQNASLKQSARTSTRRRPN